ncbi:MAG: type II toxin-antitoxin system mRNA interferase toxin, RelE/StbE family [Gammaproteobacteria bacterium]|nr:type II toxin-antitoxin system mRNA interferase toxin, RelE/StbE family [Gammaproteobacteria bacterium]
MDVKIRNKGLRRFYLTGDERGIPEVLSNRLARRLDDLATANHPRDLDLPGYRLHALKGKLVGYWSIRVSGNWRLIFRINNGEAVDVDLIDYH